MLTLRYPTPLLVSETRWALEDARLPVGGVNLFDCPLQGEPGLSLTHARELGRLTVEIRRQLKTVSAMVCHPHRIGIRNAVSVTLSNRDGKEINLLLMVVGQVTFPGQLASPRWVIEVTDSVDIVYLLLWLGELFNGPEMK